MSAGTKLLAGHETEDGQSALVITTYEPLDRIKM